MLKKTTSKQDISRLYEDTRLANKRILTEREDEIFSQIPEIVEIDSKIRSSYLELAKNKLLSGEDANLAESTKENTRILSDKKRRLLTDFGYPADYLDPIYTCPICMDTGTVGQTRCTCFTEQLIDSLYLQSNLRNILDLENFDTFQIDYYSKDPVQGKQYSPYENMMNILTKSKQFVDDFDTKQSNILMYGETGLGKTFLTNCIAKELLDKGKSVFYLSANELFNDVLGEFLMNNNFDLEDLYKYVYNSELLVIDDLGTELTNNFVASHFFEIVNKRILSGRSTLISTNLSMKQLRDRYTERIMSRLIDNYTIFNIYGENIRYQKRKKAINNLNT